ncbi:MAG: imidazole glycerol phosphate synthase subunit HisH [Spirosomataceae bacterium]
MVGIVNYGSGNVYAIANLHKSANIDFFVSGNPMDLKKASHLILPGVGAFDSTMNTLNKLGLYDYLNEEVLIAKKPIIGICVGMQILGESSEEGNQNGFGWIKGKIKKIPTQSLMQKPLLPHLGWNSIEIINNKSNLFNNIDNKKGFYFLHSYYFEPTAEIDILAKTSYGLNFCSAINHENVFGLQFHPEKSHTNGINIFKNFSKI